MRNIFIIFRKEMRETLRDYRTLLIMILVPLIFLPLLLDIMVKLTAAQKQKAAEKVLNVAFCVPDAAELEQRLRLGYRIRLRTDLPAAAAAEGVRNGSIDVAVTAGDDFADRLRANGTAQVTLVHKSSGSDPAVLERVESIVGEYRDEVRRRRLQALKIDPAVFTPLDVRHSDVSSIKEKLGEALGGFLPYIFVIFCFMGAMYPAIDLGAGEKERGTIETLLVAPAERREIVLGKFLVPLTTGIVSALVSVFGLYMGIRQTGQLPPALLNAVIRLLEWKTIALVFSLILPLAVFFSAVLLSVSIFARSFKEAQSIMMPLNLVVVLPVFAGLAPGLRLNAVTALVPILNVSLATKEIIAGTARWPLLLEVHAGLAVLAGLALWFCSAWFRRESVIFR